MGRDQGLTSQPTAAIASALREAGYGAPEILAADLDRDGIPDVIGAGSDAFVARGKDETKRIGRKP